MPYEPPLAVRPVDGENPPPGPDPGPEPPPEPVPPPGSTADYQPGQFVIAAEPIKRGEIGRAYIDGVCPAKVKILSESHHCVELAPTAPPMLQSASAGSAQLLWKQPEVDRVDDVAWCLIRIGNVTARIVVRLQLAESIPGSASEPTRHKYDLYPESGAMSADTRIARNVDRVLARGDAGRYLPAPDDSYAVAGVDQDGSWIIFQCDERPETATCNSAPVGG